MKILCFEVAYFFLNMIIIRCVNKYTII